MNDELRRRIELLRTALEADPQIATAGELPPGAASIPPVDEPLEQHRQLLLLTDGPSLGPFFFSRYSRLESNQWLADDYPGGRDRWLCIGRLDDEPILLDRRSGEVYWIYPDTPDDIVEAFSDPDDRSHCFGDLDGFLLNDVLGDRYKLHYDDNEGYDYAEDEWYQLLKHHGFVSEQA